MSQQTRHPQEVIVPPPQAASDEPGGHPRRAHDGGSASAHTTAPGTSTPRPAAGAAGGGVGSDSSIAILAAYRDSGGIERGDDLGRTFEARDHGGYVHLARLLAARDIFGFRCRGTLWIPMFQFNPHDLAVVEGPRRVVAELSDTFDTWQLARWFVAGNVSLDQRRPIDLLDTDLGRVLEAARKDRAD